MAINLSKCGLQYFAFLSWRFREEVSSHVVGEFDASVGFQPRIAQSYNHVKRTHPLKYEELECIINGDYSITGRKEGNEVYMPFSFIQKYFEV